MEWLDDLLKCEDAHRSTDLWNCDVWEIWDGDRKVTICREPDEISYIRLHGDDLEDGTIYGPDDLKHLLGWLHGVA